MAFIIDSVLKGIGQKKAAKEAYKKEEQNLQSQFESERDMQDNAEDDRLMRMRQIAGQLKGARALSPEVIAAALARRRNTARKGVAVDRSKGMGWNMAGNIAGDIGNMAMTYMSGGLAPAAKAAAKKVAFKPANLSGLDLGDGTKFWG